jgi:hypothetical protein
LNKAEQEQQSIIGQISDRAAGGRPRLAALDDMLDRLEATRSEIAAAKPTEDDGVDRLADLRAQVNPDNVRRIVETLLFYLRDHADTTAKQPFIDLVRQFIQKVVIGKTPGHQPATLEVHGPVKPRSSPPWKLQQSWRRSSRH